VTYLSRTAQRISPSARPAARPVMPSRSPLAAADQRLNIDSFASRFGMRVDSSPPPASPAELEPQLEESSEQHTDADAAKSRPARSQQARPPENAVPAADDGSFANPSHPRERRAEIREAPVGRRPSIPPPAARSLPPAGNRKPEPERVTSNDRPDSASDPFHRPAVRDDSPALEGPVRRSPRNPLQPAAVEPVIAPPPAAGRRSPDNVLDAVNRTLAWVEAGARESREKERTAAGSPDRRAARWEGPQPRPGENVRARPSRASAREARPITHLEIGKIEVEIVQPEKPAANAARARSGPTSTSGPTSAPPYKFGWRQR
jgi:hypothetical protein